MAHILFVDLLLVTEVGVHFLYLLDEQLLHLALVYRFDALDLAQDNLLELSGAGGTRGSKDFIC